MKIRHPALKYISEQVSKVLLNIRIIIKMYIAGDLTFYLIMTFDYRKHEISTLDYLNMLRGTVNKLKIFTK